MKNVSLGKKIKGWDYIPNTINDKNGIDLLNGEPLPYKDKSVDNVYIDHVLEQLPDNSVINLLRECHRIMKRGGILRIAAINSTFYYHAHNRGDKEAFYGLAEILLQSDAGFKYDYFRASIDQLFLLTFATQLSDLVGGCFRVTYEDMVDGSAVSVDNDLTKVINDIGFVNALTKVLQENIDIEEHKKNPFFINWMTIGKLHDILLKQINPEIQKGFNVVYINSYGQSSSPLMRDTTQFDTFPQGSLFVECWR